MYYYTLINKWCYTILAILIYAVNVQIKSMMPEGMVSPNFYGETGLFLFVAYLVTIDFFIPLFTGKSTLELSSGWKSAMRASLVENSITYLLVWGFLVLTCDITVSRWVLGTSFLSSFLLLSVAHWIVPKLFGDLIDHESSHSQTKKSKRVIIWGINYFPEPTGIGPQSTHLAETLVANGYQVTVVTAFSYYPTWAKDPRDESRVFRADSIRGVNVRRCWLYVPEQPSFIKRVFQQISFIVSSGLQLMFMKSPSFYIGVSPPFMIGPVLYILSKIKRTPYVIHLQDDEIGAAFETTQLPTVACVCLRQLERVGLKGAKVLSTISPRMRDRLKDNLSRANVQKKVILLSNRAHASGKIDAERVKSFRSKYPSRRLLVYTGNLGDKQVLDDFIQPVSKFDRSALILVICGEGAQKKKLARLVDACAADNVVFQGLLSDSDHEALLAAADACLLSERTHQGTWLSPGICFASKMLSYLKHSKPILVYGNPQSEVVGIVKEHESGFYLKPEQSIDSLLQEFLECEELQSKGCNGYRFYESFLKKYDPVSWITLIERHIAEQLKVDEENASIPGKIGKGIAEILLRVIGMPLAVLLYGVLAIPIKSGRREQKTNVLPRC